MFSSSLVRHEDGSLLKLTGHSSDGKHVPRRVRDDHRCVYAIISRIHIFSHRQYRLGSYIVPDRVDRGATTVRSGVGLVWPDEGLRLFAVLLCGGMPGMRIQRVARSDGRGEGVLRCRRYVRFPLTTPLSQAKSIRGRSDHHLASVCLGRTPGQVSPAVPSSQQRDIRSRRSRRRFARRTALRLDRLEMGLPRSCATLLVLRLGLPSSGASKAGVVAAGSKGFGEGREGGFAGQRFAGEGMTLSLGTFDWLRLITTADAVHHALHAGDQPRRR
jgi:hypothetical protein